MNTGFPFFIYYPKRRHIFLIKELVYQLVIDLSQNKSVYGVIFWAEQFKGENMSFYVKCKKGAETGEIEKRLEEKVNAFLRKNFEPRGNDDQQDCFFMDYSTNCFTFNNFRYDQEKLEQISGCLNKDNAGLTVKHLQILQMKEEWKTTDKLKLSFVLLSNLLALLDKSFNIEVKAMLNKLYIDFIRHYEFDTVTNDFHAIVKKGNSMYETIEVELKDLSENHLAIIAPELFQEWLAEATDIIGKSGKSEPKIYRQMRDMFILTSLELGLGPDTGLMLLIWIQKFTMHANTTVDTN